MATGNIIPIHLTGMKITIEGLGEISFLSSFWRKVLANNKNAYLDFQSLGLLEWSKVFYSTFDIADIERRHQQALDNGEHMYSMQDMADSDDPVLSEGVSLDIENYCTLRLKINHQAPGGS